MGHQKKNRKNIFKKLPESREILKQTVKLRSAAFHAPRPIIQVRQVCPRSCLLTTQSQVHSFFCFPWIYPSLPGIDPRTDLGKSQPEIRHRPRSPPDIWKFTMWPPQKIRGRVDLCLSTLLGEQDSRQFFPTQFRV